MVFMLSALVNASAEIIHRTVVGHAQGEGEKK
jgi:hypothetical protein